ncbi:2TM domain-containing protein [Polaribacter uvawellassae]|uniref:2TM domain-containing protein n=1 Tax=Polaribacter uvawellassae TaxID=3133495 RepID=UPI003219977F
MIETNAYLKAKKRVEDIKGFYIHLAIYFTINIFISSVQIIDGFKEDKLFSEIFSDFGMYAVWLFWGIGIIFHWLGVFESKFFGKKWEERKLNEILEKE